MQMEKKDIEEKDKINSNLVFGESRSKIHYSFSNFDYQELISFSIYLKIIKPPLSRYDKPRITI